MLNGLCGFVVDLVCCRLSKKSSQKYEDAVANLPKDSPVVNASLIPPQEVPSMDILDSSLPRSDSNMSDGSYHSVENVSLLPPQS